MLIASPSRRRAATLVAVAAWGVLGGPALAQGVTADAPYRLGFNHVRLVGSCLVGDPLATPAAVLADIAALGGQGFRHVEGADVSWWQLLELGGAIDFEGPYALDPPPATGSDSSPDCAFGPDDYLLNDLDLYGLPTLFQTGYAGVLANLDEDLAEALDAADWDRFFALSALIQTVGPSSGRSEPDAMYTPTGAELDVADPEVAAQVQAYVTAMVTAYRAGTHHWEVGNETELNTHHNDLFFAYKPRIYAELLEAVGEAARQADPGAQVVFGGLSTPPNSDGSLVNPPWHRWLDRVLNKGGGDHFDVLSFHFYPADFPDGWRSLKPTIDTLKDLLTDHDAAGKALWLTEVGIGVTDVGEEQQAGDMARMLTIAFGNGVQLVNWHTHISPGRATACATPSARPTAPPGPTSSTPPSWATLRSRTPSSRGPASTASTATSSTGATTRPARRCRGAGCSGPTRPVAPPATT